MGGHTTSYALGLNCPTYKSYSSVRGSMLTLGYSLSGPMPQSVYFRGYRVMD